MKKQSSYLSKSRRKFTAIVVPFAILFFSSACKKEQKVTNIDTSDVPIESHVDLDAGKDTLFYADGRRVIKNIVVKASIIKNAKAASTSAIPPIGTGVEFTYYDDEDDLAAPPNPISVGASKYEDQNTGMIENVFSYYAVPRSYLSQYEDNGRYVTRRTSVTDLSGRAAPLPAYQTLVTWDYFVLRTYNYNPYYPERRVEMHQIINKYFQYGIDHPID